MNALGLRALRALVRLVWLSRREPLASFRIRAVLENAIKIEGKEGYLIESKKNRFIRNVAHVLLY